MSIRKRTLSRDEIGKAFDDSNDSSSPILSPKDLAKLLGLSTKTVYFWIAAGRLDGAFRKRGKHCLIWRDKAIDLLFNGSEWSRD